MPTSLCEQLKSYFTMLETNSYSTNEKNHLKVNIENDINDCDDQDELREAQEFVNDYLASDMREDSQKSNNILYSYGSNMLKGMAIGAGFGLFASSAGLGAALGSLGGFEFAGLKYQYLKYQTTKMAKVFEASLEDRIAQLDQPGPSQ